MNFLPDQVTPHFDSAAPVQELGLEDIALIMFRTKGGGTEEKRALLEWSRKQPLMAMESCTRHVLLGFGSTMDLTMAETIAKRSNSGVDVMRGREAYSFVLRLVTGMLSTDRNDTQIKGQFFSTFDKFKEENGAHLGNALNRILNSMRSDSKRLQRDFTNNIIIPKHAQIARQLLDLPKKASLAVMCTLKNEQLPDTAVEIMSVFGSRKGRVSML